MIKTITTLCLIIGSLSAANEKPYLQHNIYMGPLYSIYGIMDRGDSYIGTGFNYEFRINQFGANIYLQHSLTRMFENNSLFSNQMITAGLYSDTNRSLFNANLFLGLSYMRNVFPGIGLSLSNNYKWVSLKAMGYLGYHEFDFIQATWSIMIGTYLKDLLTPQDKD